MSTSISRSALLCSLLTGLAGLSGCSDKDPADVSFQEVDTSVVPTNIIPNSDLSQSNTEWTGWSAEVDESNGVVAEFELAPTLGQGGNSLKTSVLNVEVDSAPDDLYAGPSSVAVKPGQAYGVAAHVQGPRCGLTRFIVNPVGNTGPELILASQNIFLTGEPQTIEFFFQVPESAVTSVDMPVQMGFADNIGGTFFIDRMVAMPIPVLPPVQEGNVARNSDFEESDTAISVDGSWANSGAGATFSLSTDVAQNGNNSVKIVFDTTVGSGDPWAIEGGSVEVPVVSGWTYVFSAWVKGDEGGKINFLVQNPTQYNSYGTQEISTLTSEWQEVRFEAQISGTDVVRLYAQYNFPENKGKTIYIDNIKLIPPDTCPYTAGSSDLVSDNQALFEYNHVTNSSLEEDLLEAEGWSTSTSGAATAQFDMQIVLDEFNRTLVNRGNQALKTSVTTTTSDPADIQVGPADLYVVPGQTYIYSAYARGPVGTKAQFTSSFPDAPSLPLEAATVTFDNIWQQVTFDFTVPDNAPVLNEEELKEAGFPEDAQIARLNMIVNMGYPENGGKPIFLDDFVLLPNAIRNGDLEDSSTAAEGWMMAASGSLASFALDSTDAHTGENSLRVSIGKDAAALTNPQDPASFSIQLDDIEAGVENIPVEGGRRYFVSARVNGESGSRLKLSVTSADGSRELAAAGTEDADNNGIPDGVALTGGWQEITFAANLPEGTESVNLVAQMGYAVNALRTINLDSFRLVSQIPPLPVSAANLIADGEFETGNAAGWSGSDATISVVSSPEGVYSGRYALYVSNRTATWGSAQYDLGENALTIGDTYFASAWVKVDGADADLMKMTLRVDYAEGGTDYLSITTSGETDTRNWTRLSSVFTFTPTAAHVGKTVASLKPYIEAERQATNYFIDDVFVTKVFNTNGGFESGMDGWSPAGATVVVTDADKRSGNSSAHVSSRSDGWSSVQYDMRELGLVPGRTYLISAWVKRDGAAPENIKMTIEQEDEAGNANRWRTIAQSSDTADWVQLSNAFTYLPTGDVTTLKIYFEADGPNEGGGGGAYFVDDLIITEFVPPASIITNGGLEAGATTGWVGSGATIAIEQWPQGGAHSGFFGLRVSGRSAFYDSAQYPLLELGLEPNTSYKASVWVKVVSETTASDTFKLTLNFTDEGGQKWLTVAEGVVSSDGWTKLEGVVDYAPTGTVTDLKLYVEAAEGATSYFLDDLVVTPNLVFNGGLEANATDVVGWSAAGATLSLDSATKYSGARSLFVTGRTALWNSAQYDLRSSGMVPGRTYDISAWVKIEGATSSVIKMTLESKLADAAGSTYTSLDRADDTAEWVKLSRRYTFGFDEMPAVFKVYFEADEADGENNPPATFSSYYVDSLVITEVEETYTH